MKITLREQWKKYFRFTIKILMSFWIPIKLLNFLWMGPSQLEKVKLRANNFNNSLICWTKIETERLQG
jgi:hypothetical protein